MKKITIVGAGRVGESEAQILAKEELCRELVMIDIQEGVPQGVALDVQESGSLLRFDTRVRGDTDPAAMADSDMVIVTAGFPRKPGMSRSDVLDANLEIIEGIVDNVLRHAPNAMLMMVTNPVDVLTWYAWKKTGWARQRVFGQSGALDTARMASFIALETGYSVKDISALVLGGHGDAMVPLARFTDISGIPIEHFLSDEAIDRIVERTRQGGGEILELEEAQQCLRFTGRRHRHHGRCHQSRPPAHRPLCEYPRRRIRPARYRHGCARGAGRKRTERDHRVKS